MQTFYRLSNFQIFANFVLYDTKCGSQNTLKFPKFFFQEVKAVFIAMDHCPNTVFPIITNTILLLCTVVCLKRWTYASSTYG